MAFPIYQVDAFTDTPFRGNPAAVLVLTEKVEAEWMQKVAREMNLSETAFLLKEADGYNLRWFTPSVEVDLCGHATLASAHILWEQNYLSREQEAKFFTKSGLLSAKTSNGWIELNFPAEPEEEVAAPKGLLEGLGVEPKYIGKNRLDYIVEVESEDLVKGMKPDLDLLSRISARGVIVTAKSNSREFDFISRFFAPVVGVNEDPVTGSAHCCLGPFWQERLGKDEFIAYQASPRGGIVKVRLDADRVYLGGQAITVLVGELLG